MQFSYDGIDRLTKATDRAGRALVFAYASSVLDSITLPDGKVVKYTYDAQRLSAVSYQVNHIGAPQFSTIQYKYDDSNDYLLLTGIIDENNERYAS